MDSFRTRVLESRNRRSKRYAHSASSIGDCIGVIDSKDLWFEAIGPALADFIQMQEDLQRELDIYCPPVDGSNWITFGVYMIGNDEENSAPAVMFFSKDRKARKNAMHAIKSSGLLTRYPGFKLGNRSLPPDLNDLVQPMCEISTVKYIHHDKRKEAVE
jgi:hypothetical protein